MVFAFVKRSDIWHNHIGLNEIVKTGGIKMDKFFKTALITVALMVFGAVPAAASQYDDMEFMPFNTVSRTINLNSTTQRSSNDGNVNNRIGGFDWEAWTDARGVGPGSTMTIFTNGSFTSSWSETYNTLFRVGRRFPGQGTRLSDMGDISLRYSASNFNSNRGATYLCVYGWTRGITRNSQAYSQIEWYIVDNWRNWINAGNNPPNTLASGYTHHGTLVSNGSTYDIITGWRVNQPSLTGNTTFLQIFSVRRGSQLTGSNTGPLNGTIDLSAHFAAWENRIGLQVHSGTSTRARWGNDLLLYEISFTVEGFGGDNGSSGTGNVNALCITYTANRVCTGGSSGCNHCIDEPDPRPALWSLPFAVQADLSQAANVSTHVLSRFGDVVAGGTRLTLNAAGHLVIAARRPASSTDGAVFNLEQAGISAEKTYRIHISGTIANPSAGTNFRVEGLNPAIGSSGIDLGGNIHNAPLGAGNRFNVDFTLGPNGDVKQSLVSLRLCTNAAGAGATITIDTFNVTEWEEPATTWADVLAAPFFAPRNATVTAAENGLTVSARGTGTHDHNNGLFIDIFGLRALVGGTPDIVITGTAAGTTAGRFDFQGTGRNVSVTSANRNFSITVQGNAVIDPPSWGGALPFIGTNEALRNVSFTITGVTIGGVSVLDLIGGVQFFTVTFLPNGGTNNGLVPFVQTVRRNGTAAEPALIRDGYIFNDWNRVFNNITANTDVTAQWLRLGAITSDGTGNVTSADLTWLARHVAGHSGFTVLPNRRLGNLRGLDRDPVLSDVTLMARWLLGYDLESLRAQTLP
jgi:endo-1,4-beta-xylanase